MQARLEAYKQYQVRRLEIFVQVHGMRSREIHGERGEATCLLSTQDAAEALGLLAPGAAVTGDLDQHVGLRNVDGVVAHLGEEHRVDLQAGAIQGSGPRSEILRGQVQAAE